MKNENEIINDNNEKLIKQKENKIYDNSYKENYSQNKLYKDY
jgi:hypothetical protein